jgi:hypothetical protein
MCSTDKPKWSVSRWRNLSNVNAREQEKCGGCWLKVVFGLSLQWVLAIQVSCRAHGMKHLACIFLIILNESFRHQKTTIFMIAMEG